MIPEQKSKAQVFVHRLQEWLLAAPGDSGTSSLRTSPAGSVTRVPLCGGTPTAERPPPRTPGRLLAPGTGHRLGSLALCHLLLRLEGTREWRVRKAAETRPRPTLLQTAGGHFHNETLPNRDKATSKVHMVPPGWE